MESLNRAQRSEPHALDREQVLGEVQAYLARSGRKPADKPRSSAQLAQPQTVGTAQLQGRVQASGQPGLRLAFLKSTNDLVAKLASQASDADLLEALASFSRACAAYQAQQAPAGQASEEGYAQVVPDYVSKRLADRRANASAEVQIAIDRALSDLAMPAPAQASAAGAPGQWETRHAHMVQQAMTHLARGKFAEALSDLASARAIGDRIASERGLKPSERKALRKELMIAATKPRLTAATYTADSAEHDWKKLGDAVNALPELANGGIVDKEAASDLLLLRSIVVHRGAEPPVQPLKKSVGALVPVVNSRFNSLGSQYTTWGVSVKVGKVRISSLGQALGGMLRWAVLSAPAHALGSYMQKGHVSTDWTYRMGRVIKGCANLTGGIVSAAGGVVTVGESVVANIGSAVLRTIAATVMATGAGTFKLAGLASHRADAIGDRLLSTAKEVARFSWLFKGRQQPLPPTMYAQALALQRLARYTGTTDEKLRAEGPPEPFKHASHDLIPSSILASMGEEDEPEDTGTVARLKFDAADRLSYSSWSGLRFQVFEVPGEDGKPMVHLHFVGTKYDLKSTLKEDLAGGLGIESSSFQKAEKLVAEFVKKHPGRVQLSGHSLGGALAAWGAVKNDVPAMVFNAMGLHAKLRDELGSDRLDKGNVVYVNSETDALSQFAEAPRFGLTASSQVGPRYVVLGSKGHSVSGSENQLRLALIHENYPSARDPGPIRV